MARDVGRAAREERSPLALTVAGVPFCTLPFDLPGRFERHVEPMPVPGAHPLVRGVVEIRGRILTVVDLAGCVGGEVAGPTGSEGLLLALAPPLAHLALELPENAAIATALRREDLPHIDVARLEELLSAVSSPATSEGA